MGLQIKPRGNILEVDLDVIKNNLRYFRSKLKKKTKLMVVLKSSCYAGAELDVAELVEDMQVDYIAVSCFREGVAFRSHGLNTPIMVLNVQPALDSFNKMWTNNLEPVIYSLAMLYKLAIFVKEHKKCINIHLKLDTGTNRNGIAEGDVDTVINTISTYKDLLTVRSIFSEFAGEDSSEHDEYTILQASKFIKTARDIERELNITTIKHLVGTLGILRLPAFHYDMVRLGAGLLGVGIDKRSHKEVEEAMTLKSVVSQLRTIPRGTIIAGEQKTTASRDMNVAIINIGYGDGFRRCLGNGVGTLLVNRHLASTVGKVCRDTTLIDVTGMMVNVDDEVIIFGKALPLGNIAYAARTIPQEILCSIHNRVKRMCYSTFEV